MAREENAAVFRDTERLCTQHPVLKQSIQRSTDAQKVIPERDRLPEIKKDIYDTPAKITVSKRRTFEAAAQYEGCKVAVHNFASATNPGGGVANGSSAQEESLCRCSTLYFCLNTQRMWDGFYAPHRRARDPRHNDDIIYTPDVTVFKTDTDYPETMDKGDWYAVNVITCAAPNLRPRPENRHNVGDGGAAIKLSHQELGALHEKRLRRILDIAAMEGNDTVILGAFGCGAFLNDPEVVAQAMRTVLGEYRMAFKNIEVAVYCSPRDDRNFKVFERTLKPMERMLR